MSVCLCSTAQKPFKKSLSTVFFRYLSLCLSLSPSARDSAQNPPKPHTQSWMSVCLCQGPQILKVVYAWDMSLSLCTRICSKPFKSLPRRSDVCPPLFDFLKKGLQAPWFADISSLSLYISLSARDSPNPSNSELPHECLFVSAEDLKYSKTPRKKGCLFLFSKICWNFFKTAPCSSMSVCLCSTVQNNHTQTHMVF